MKEGIKNETTMLVTQKDTAKSYGSGLIEVFATPAMIAMMENTAHISVQDYLPKGSVTVGIEINVKHIKATPIGMQVTCQSILERIEGNRLSFAVEAYDNHGKIGEGTHVRYIVDEKRFMDKLK